jgi:ribosomal protein S27AE
MATFGNTRRSYQSLMVDSKVMHANCPRCGDSSPISVNPDNGNHRIYCYTCNKYRRISVSGLTPLAVDACPFCVAGFDPNFEGFVPCTACDGTGRATKA